ncbi:MAG: GWxTD domain-containing protein [Candidatus Kryptoniota bacterium]
MVLLTFNLTASAQLSDRRLGSSTIWVLSQNMDSVTVCVAYSIPFRNLIFVQDTSKRFVATLSFSVDAVDSVTGENFHRFGINRVVADSYQESRNAKSSAEDCVVFQIPKSTFSFNIEVRDDLQKITYMNIVLRKHFQKNQFPILLQPIFLASKTDSTLNPIVEESTAEFPFTIKVLIISPVGISQKPTASIFKDGKEVSPVSRIDLISLSLQPTIQNSQIKFSFKYKTDNALLLEFQTDTLIEGKYEIHIKYSGREETYPFHYVWLNKPGSLHNFHFALQLLKYITDDSTYSYITSGNDRSVKEKFEQFWKQHDPTPRTAYNEAEAEFYRRADYAVYAFRTATAINGAMTDRGKIYILYGKPDNVERDLRNNGSYEIWSYSRLKRKMIFKEVRPGEFKLYQTEKL